jgi:hypothetical protein
MWAEGILSYVEGLQSEKMADGSRSPLANVVKS